ncbi:AraC family transcriptional regulator [Aquipuribacter sp. MA13-6]|uniref:AraC family transcriptional regulator n=1 Tax=unclassified Aquipuribacter TaxID=2635084 RepID=UPI003EEFACD3
MDALARLLDGPRGRDAYLLRASMEPPWSVRLADEAPLGLVAVLRGSAWLTPDGGPAVELGPGSVVVSRGTEACTVSDSPSTPPHVVVLPAMRCVGPDGRDLGEQMTLGLRQWGNNRDGSTVMLMGCYQVRGEVSQRLLGALPRLVHLPPGALDSPLLPMLDDAVVTDEPGQAAVLDRLFDLLLVAVLRAWLARQEPGRGGWWTAQGDPVVGPALRLIHDDPAHPWTIAGLAAEVGISRAALARRFAQLVGEPPMTYLTRWRLALAADRLLEPRSTVEAVAREVGYGSAFALSTAFKRERGVSPRDHRARARSS